jgi:DNA primase
VPIPQSFVDDLLTRVDVVEVVGRHVQLKKGGANLLGLCPFHGEKSPSFTVSPTKQFFHCFGCGKHGNAIGFLMEHAGMGFVDAVKELAGSVGMTVPEDERSPAQRAAEEAQRERRASLSDVLQQAGHAWRRELKATPRAVQYLKNRGLSGEIARDYGLGYAPATGRFLSTVFPDYGSALLSESGLVRERADERTGELRRYDAFRDRITFPIRNVRGECIGFGARILDQGEPKYLNSPETPVFSKGRELYGLFEARGAIHQAGFALVCEGYMDVVALAQLGFGNAVATLGTACTPEHVQKLLRFTDAIAFSFDGDAAGRRAARRALDAALPHATDTRSIKFVFLPPEHDPDSFIRTHGRDAFARCVSDATPLSRFVIESARQGCDLSTIEGRSKAATQARPLWTPLPEGAIKRQLLTELAQSVQLEPRELLEIWQQANRRDGPPSGAAERPRAGSSATPHHPTRNKQAAQPPSPWPAARTRRAPPGRGQRALQILLADAAQWERLSADEHQLLTALPDPVGPLLGWLDAVVTHDGALPWPALLRHLDEQVAQGQAALAPLRMAAHSAMQAVDAHIQSDPAELAGIVQALRTERRQRDMQTLAQQAASDPAAFERYRQLLAEIAPPPSTADHPAANPTGPSEAT